ncbi:unnamed protein product [Polarella glacialis]|uniref:ribonuclease H n=2 Tax=Polarella glacialis TaxID=89957 RepID=A0A813EHL2_POLGL|nr:unnamed protein product [Polarella glacialis]
MRHCGCYEHGIPTLKQSLEKGHLLGTGFNHDLGDPFKGKLISVPPPTEDYAVSLLTDYNRKCTDPLMFLLNRSENVAPGIGSTTFLAPEFRNRWDKWMEDLEPGLVPCRLCSLGLPHDAFSKTQVQDWNRRGVRARPRCRNCLEAVSSVRSGAGSPSVQDDTCDLDPTGILADEAGRLTGNAEEIDDLLQRAWGPIFAMYVDGGEPDWEEFEKRFGEHFRSAVMNVSDITGPELRIEGWRVEELAALSDLLLDRLAEFYNVVERTATWPHSLERAVVSLIPKGQGSRPLDLRPISDLKGWQELWATSGQHAFRADHSTEDVFWVLALQVEAALLDCRHLYGLKFDFANRILGRLNTMYLKLVRRFKFAGSVGKEFRATNGILQGCISVILLNALLSVWARAVEAEVTGVSADTFADDVGVSSYEPASTQLAADLTNEFARLTNQELSIKKSFSFTTAVSMDPVFVAGEALQIKRHADVLGASISFDGSTQAGKSKDKATQATLLANRLFWLPLSWEQKSQVAKALVMGKVLFGSSVADADIMSLKKLRSAIVRALWSKRSRFRCLEIVFTFLAPGHQLDPMWALAHHAIMVAQSMLQRRPELRDMFAAVWRARQTERSRLPGPVGKLVAAATLMGLSWGSALELRKGDGDTMDVLLSSRGELGHFLREGMRRVCWHRAAERRADMAGLEGVVDVDATVSLLRTRSCEYVHQGILRNILAGSLAFGHRLFKAGILPDDRCRFCSAGCPETAVHMFWECPAWQSERGKHSLAIGSYRSDWPNYFKLCGIMTAEVALLPLSSMSEHSVAALATAPDAHLDHEHPAETLLEGKVVVYTDGACVRNQHKALRRAGYGAFWGPGHIQNWSAPLRGRCKRNQRAELQAVVHVLQHEARDVHIKSDSEYVVKGFLHHRLAWRALGWRKVSHRDLWQALDELVEARLPGAVRMSKVKGHANYSQGCQGWTASWLLGCPLVFFAGQPVAEDRLSHAFITNVRARQNWSQSCDEAKGSSWDDCEWDDVCQYPTPVVDAYDCEQALGNVSSWPEVKRAWCCSRHGLGCPKQEVAKYDCQRGWVDGAPLWGDEQRYWCCFHTGLGCVSTSKPYDCAAGLENWKAGWSEQKKHWCCENEGTACRVQFDCAAGLANWEHGWTQDKKQWCCRAGHATCIKESHGYDCDADFSRWQAVWPEDKRTWCCHNTDRGCFKVESFTERYDCYNDVPSWDTHRRKWCCEHHRDTCDVGLPAQ